MENYADGLDLTYWPLKNPDLDLYTDGSSFLRMVSDMQGLQL
jgi:hypothetical protein